MTAGFDYDVFISYSTAADRRLATALRSGLQKFAKPWNRRRALRVFLDQDSLEPSSDLSGALVDRLRSTRYLILLASRESARSRWCDHEVAVWLNERGTDSLLLVHTDSEGALVWDVQRGAFDPVATTSLPPTLLDAFTHEPLWLDMSWVETEGDAAQLDIRSTRFRQQVASLAAPIHGRRKDDLDGEDVRQQATFRRVRRAAVSALGVLLVAAVVLGLVARVQRDRAVSEAATAKARLAEVSVDDDMRTAFRTAAEAFDSRQNPRTQAALYNVLAATASLEWSRDVADGTVTSAVPVGDATVYGTSGGVVGIIDGDAEFAPVVQRESAVVDVTPDASDGVVAVGWADGHVATFDVATRSVTFEADLPGAAVQVAPLDRGGAGVMAVGDEVWVADEDGVRSLPSPIGGRIRLVGGVATGGDGFIWVVDVGTGEMVGFVGEDGSRNTWVDAASGVGVGTSLNPTDRTVRITQVSGAGGGFSFERERVDVRDITLSGDGSTLAVLSDGLLEVWTGWGAFDVTSGVRRSSLVRGVAPSATAVAVDHTGAVAVTSGGSTIQRWTLGPTAVAPELGIGGAAESLVGLRVVGETAYWLADPIGQQVAAVDLVSGAWSTIDGSDPEAVALLGVVTADAELRVGATSPDGTMRADLVGGRVVVVDTATGDVVADFDSNESGVLAFSDDGGFLVKSSFGGGLRYWSLRQADVCDALDRRVAPGVSAQVCPD